MEDVYNSPSEGPAEVPECGSLNERLDQEHATPEQLQTEHQLMIAKEIEARERRKARRLFRSPSEGKKDNRSRRLADSPEKVEFLFTYALVNARLHRCLPFQGTRPF